MTSEDQIAALEARVRALEAIIHNLPVVTQDVMEAAGHEIVSRRPHHPMDATDRPHEELRASAEDALTEIWRQLRSPQND